MIVLDRKTLSLKKQYDFKWLFIISLAINILSFAYPSDPNRVEYKPVIVDSDSNTLKDIELSDTSIIKELVRLDCVLPNVALAQFKVESAHFKSRIAIENKNIAGIKTSQSEYVKGKRHGHCVYASYRDCIRDYVRIQNRYLKNIDGRYAENGGYINLVKKVQ